MEELLDAWINGDAEAGRELVRLNYRRILRFFAGKVGPEVARDLTQETFETLCRRRQAFRRDSTVQTYLFGIARWKLVHHFQRKRGAADRFRPSVDVAHEPAVDASITSLFAARERELMVVRALRSLAFDDQVILELKDYEGMSAKDIGDVFEVGRDTAASRIRRARTRLAEAVRAQTQAPDPSASQPQDLAAAMAEIRERIDALLQSP